jgi:hypothetical protein
MEKNTERILKSNDVEMSGCVTLDNSIGDTSTRTAMPAGHVQAVVIENTPEFAVIEVICPCGRRSQIRCEYANAE